MKLFCAIKRNLFSIFQTGLVALLVVMVVVFVVVLWSEEPLWIFEFLGLGERAEPKHETLKFVGIGMGGVLVALQALMSYKRAKAMEETANAQADAVLKTEEGQRQERMKNAIEHLGHESDSVRLGGAYELFHLAEDTEAMRQTVLDILCAHIRQTTGGDAYREKHKSKPSEEVQSLLTLLFASESEVFNGFYINLKGSWLNGVDLARAHLMWGDLSDAHLQGASFSEANLIGASFFGADMHGAYLVRAKLAGASLYGARLSGSNLGVAQMPGTDLFEAQLHGVNLASAKMQGAILGGAQLQGAYLEGTDLRGVRCEEDISESFAQRIMQSIGHKSDLSWIFFSGGVDQTELESIVGRISKENADRLREKLRTHVDKSPNHELPKDCGAITGSYTEEEAKRWITEHDEAIAEALRVRN